MKNFLFILVTSVLLCSCSQEEFVYNKESLQLDDIAKVKIYDLKGNKAISITTEYLKEKWEAQIKEEKGLSVILEKFEILQSALENGETTYFLKAKSKDGTIETGAFLTKDKKVNELFKVSDQAYILGSKTCTCQGCSSGCSLTVIGTMCSCSGCPPGSIPCVKTETVVIDE